MKSGSDRSYTIWNTLLYACFFIHLFLEDLELYDGMTIFKHLVELIQSTARDTIRQALASNWVVYPTSEKVGVWCREEYVKVMGEDVKRKRSNGIANKEHIRPSMPQSNLLPALIQKCIWRLGNGSVVKSTNSSCGGLEFHSQQPLLLI